MEMGMIGGDADMGQMVMTCMPRRDSPGSISTDGIDMSDPDIQMDWLMAVLNDTCLQVWSNKYAKGFWYGIVTVIGLFTLARVFTWAKLTSRYVSIGFPSLLTFLGYVVPQRTSRIPSWLLAR